MIISRNLECQADSLKNLFPAERRESENPLNILTQSKNPAKFTPKFGDPKTPCPCLAGNRVTPL